MRKKGWLLCAAVWVAVVLTGCGNTTEGQSSAGQINRESAGEVSTAEEEDNLALKYRAMPDIEVGFISELAYHGTGQIHETYDPEIFACWEDILIIGDTIYRREDEIYKKTEEQLEDWFNILGRLEHAYQWENLLVAEHRDIADDRDKILVLDMDSGQTRSYPFDGYAWHVYQGKIYYRGHDKDILCMDLLSGEIEVIYACDWGGDFMIRDNGDMIMNTRNETDQRIWEFWFLSYDAQGDIDAKKIWETDTYEFVEMLEFNNHGLFLVGSFYHGMDRDASDELLWLKDNGEREGMTLERRWTALIGQIIVDEGYFLWDSQMLSEEEKAEILGSGRDEQIKKRVTVVDSISFYDFQGNKLQTWQLIDDEMLEAGYRLKCIVYDNGDILAFYENEEFDDLYISRVQTL